MDNKAHLPAITETERNFAVAAHLSLLLAIFGDYGILPAAVSMGIYYTQKHKSKFIARHSRGAANFHLTLILVYALYLGAFFVLMKILPEFAKFDSSQIGERGSWNIDEIRSQTYASMFKMGAPLGILMILGVVAVIWALMNAVQNAGRASDEEHPQYTFPIIRFLK